MDVHKPKAVHSWREFAVEVGTIVLGVAIAIAGEQTVEAIVWAARVDAAKAAMRTELATDDAPQAFARAAMYVCLDAQAAAVEQALVDERDRGVPFHPRKVMAPQYGTWDSFGWTSAQSSGAASHLSGGQMNAWSGAYGFMPALDEAARREAADYADLRILADAPAHPDAALRQQLLSELVRVRGDNRFIERGALGFLKFSALAGVSVPQAQRTRLAIPAALTGDCGDPPTPDGPAHAAEQARARATVEAAAAGKKGP